MTAFYLDEDVTESLAIPLRGRGYQVMTTTAAGRKGTRDHEQLWFAAHNAWILITVNCRDFESLHGAWLLWGVLQQHMGIILLHQLSEGELERIAGEIDDLVAAPDAFIVAQAIAAKSGPSVDPGGTTVNRLFRRWRGGRWGCIG